MIETLFLFLGLAIGPTAFAAADLPPVVKLAKDEDREQYRAIAECFATTDWNLVKAVFDTGIGTSEEQRVLEAAATHTHCNLPQGHFFNTELRHDIAEARYRADYSNAEFAAVAGSVEPIPPGAKFEWARSTGNRSWQAFQALAACLSERQPALVHSVLMTNEQSDEERNEMAILGQHLGSCLKSGDKIRVSTFELRSWLAESQYQMMRTRIPALEAAE
jgi:hypothetical protein